MLNIEKYKDEIASIGIGVFAFDGIKTANCLEMKCATCKFSPNLYGMCDTKKLEWLCMEYKEPEIDWDNDIDWSRVPLDTDVLVNNIGSRNIGMRSKFAIYIPMSAIQYHTFGAYENHSNATAIYPWQFCKLVNPEDVEKYRKRG